jgi:hypothetical protein
VSSFECFTYGPSGVKSSGDTFVPRMLQAAAGRKLWFRDSVALARKRSVARRGHTKPAFANFRQSRFAGSGMQDLFSTAADVWVIHLLFLVLV